MTLHLVFESDLHFTTRVSIEDCTESMLYELTCAMQDAKEFPLLGTIVRFYTEE